MKLKDIKPRDNSILALIGKSRRFEDKKRTKKLDAAERKVKHKTDGQLAETV